MRNLKVVDLVHMGIAPMYGELERSTLGVVSDWPVVLKWHHSSYVEIVEPWFHVQCH